MGNDRRGRLSVPLQSSFSLIRNFPLHSVASIIPQMHTEGTGRKDVVNGTINDKKQWLVEKLDDWVRSAGRLNCVDVRLS
jgi:hypothetical protein